MAKPLPQLQSQKRCSVARSAGPPSRRELSVATVLKVGLSLYGLRTSCPRRHPATAADVRAPRGAVLGHALRPKGPRKILSDRLTWRWLAGRGGVAVQAGVVADLDRRIPQVGTAASPERSTRLPEAALAADSNKKGGN